MREMSVAEQRHRAVLAVISDGRTVTEVAGEWKVSRQTLHARLARYETDGLDGLADRSHRPAGCPHQMPAVVESRVLERASSVGARQPLRLSLMIARRRAASRVVLNEGSPLP